MSTLGVLKRTRELLATPDSWIQDGYALVDGIKEQSLYDVMRNPAVTGRCLSCALYQAIGSAHDKDAFQAACRALGPGFEGIGDIISWNDERGRTHAEVLALIDVGIEVLERPLP